MPVDEADFVKLVTVVANLSDSVKALQRSDPEESKRRLKIANDYLGELGDAIFKKVSSNMEKLKS